MAYEPFWLTPNCYCPCYFIQAWATLAQTLQSELHDRQEAVTDLQKQVAAAQRCLESCTIKFKEEG